MAITYTVITLPYSLYCIMIIVKIELLWVFLLPLRIKMIIASSLTARDAFKRAAVRSDIYLFWLWLEENFEFECFQTFLCVRLESHAESVKECCDTKWVHWFKWQTFFKVNRYSVYFHGCFLDCLLYWQCILIWLKSSMQYVNTSKIYWFRRNKKYASY